MADGIASDTTTNRLKSTPGFNWVAGLVVSVVLSVIFTLVVVAITPAWALLFVLGLLGFILAAAVGAAVRLTTPGPGGFWPAAVTAALGVHVFTSVAGAGFSDLGDALLNSYRSAPLSFYVVFFGLPGRHNRSSRLGPHAHRYGQRQWRPRRDHQGI
jgi:hypothetical protein